MKVSHAAATSALAATAAAQANYTVECQSGLHVIVARASGEQPGFGILGPVKDQILSRIPNSDAVWVPYPATINNPVYTESQPQGVGNLTKLLTEYVDECPGGRVALLGYSQGAHVIGDTLIGPDYSAFPAFGSGTGAGQKYIDASIAVILMGDPANVAGQPFLVGNSTRSGFFPRNNTASWASTGLVGKTQSYCDAEDTFCDSGTLGQQSLAIHIGYIPEYGNQAADYVVSKFGASGSGSGGGSGNGTITSPGAGGNGTSTGNSTGSGSATSTPRTPSPSTSAPATATTNAGSSLTAGLSSAVMLVALALAL